MLVQPVPVSTPSLMRILMASGSTSRTAVSLSPRAAPDADGVAEAVSEGALVPLAFAAVTKMSYVVPLVSPLMTAGGAVAVVCVNAPVVFWGRWLMV